MTKELKNNVCKVCGCKLNIYNTYAHTVSGIKYYDCVCTACRTKINLNRYYEKKKKDDKKYENNNKRNTKETNFNNL